MKSKCVKNETTTNNEIKYPCLMISSYTGCIVLMTDSIKGIGKGTVVFLGEEDDVLGNYSVKWDMRFFTPIASNVLVILQND